MDGPSREPLRLMTEATLGAFDGPVRDLLTPLLVYKSVLLGDWLDAIVRSEPDPEVREALVSIMRDSVAESVGTLAAMRDWNAAPYDRESTAEAARVAHRRALEDILAFKEGNTETGIFVAMRAPTAELRKRMIELADRDRRQADLLRRVLGRASRRDTLQKAEVEGEPVGAHSGRQGAATLGAAVRRSLDALREVGEVPLRLVVSADSLRHLRDEGLVDPDARVLGLPVDVDFGWRGECWSLVTDERVRLAELLSREGAR